MTIWPRHDLSRQTLVINGAASSIGMATARRAGLAGARCVLVDETAYRLDALAAEITHTGGQAITAQLRNNNTQDFAHIAELADRHFGGFDTWVNDPGWASFGPLLDIDTDRHRELFERNLWSAVNGSLVAGEYLSRSGIQNGTIVNIGSVISAQDAPIQGMYSVSKQALISFTRALQLEFDAAGTPLNSILIDPASIISTGPSTFGLGRYFQARTDRNDPADRIARVLLRHVCHANQHSRRTQPSAHADLDRPAPATR
ncbi:SDR family NAD(P)-dependent oxidoreductase [Salinisphaera sp.]|uniref:SDR family NAD(P)-dependent oxidoreductase n=1 Tax=Salinisphaera sp. TaxID=1914330 RepID=UPI002D79F203|nr:SDR family NAD(P)-dependent oxidoreductase [Salinisphaera sp.]HET7314769.1 SDR family NAD(P)-dependent oxidoreductase [Salinisphaera sp.]